MLDLEKLSAKQLTALTEKRAAVSSKLCRELIQAGFGEERMSDTRKRAETTGDRLATAYIAAFELEHECHSEAQSRQRWHGSLKPIKRQAT